MTIAAAAAPTELPPRIETPKPLDASQVRSFVDDGFLTVAGLVTDDEVDELREDTVRIARGGYPC